MLHDGVHEGLIIVSGFGYEFKTYAYEHVRSLVNSMADIGDSTTNVAPPSKRMRVDEQAQAGDGGLEFLLRTKRKPIECEFDQYLQSTPPADASPLDYWKQHQSEYPRCATLARKFLSIPATSVQSERLFLPVDA